MDNNTVRYADQMADSWIEAGRYGDAETKAVKDVLDERKRQIDLEGYVETHDDQHGPNELVTAGACYALFADSYPNAGEPPPQWPWEAETWKPKNFRRDQVRACALLIAGIEAYDRKVKTHE